MIGPLLKQIQTDLTLHPALPSSLFPRHTNLLTELCCLVMCLFCHLVSVSQPIPVMIWHISLEPQCSLLTFLEFQFSKSNMYLSLFRVFNLSLHSPGLITFTFWRYIFLIFSPFYTTTAGFPPTPLTQVPLLLFSILYVL